MTVALGFALGLFYPSRFGIVHYAVVGRGGGGGGGGGGGEL